jgi:hypothetical protein
MKGFLLKSLLRGTESLKMPQSSRRFRDLKAARAAHFFRGIVNFTGGLTS